MSYNGIGLQTPRGSGSSGYVQTNKFHLRGSRMQPREHQNMMDAMNDKSQHRQANKDILDHARKRKIVLDLLTMREELEDLGMDEEEITVRLDNKKAELEKASAEEDAATNSSKETHAVAARKEADMANLREAFGIKEINEGDAFNRELQEQKRQEARAEREAREAEKRAAELKKEKAALKAAKKAKKEEKKAKKRAKKEEKKAKKAQAEEEGRLKMGLPPKPSSANKNNGERRKPAGGDADEEDARDRAKLRDRLERSMKDLERRAPAEPSADRKRRAEAAPDRAPPAKKALGSKVVDVSGSAQRKRGAAADLDGALDSDTDLSEDEAGGGSPAHRPRSPSPVDVGPPPERYQPSGHDVRDGVFEAEDADGGGAGTAAAAARGGRVRSPPRRRPSRSPPRRRAASPPRGERASSPPRDRGRAASPPRGGRRASPPRRRPSPPPRDRRRSPAKPSKPRGGRSPSASPPRKKRAPSESNSDSSRSSGSSRSSSSSRSRSRSSGSSSDSD